MRFLGRASRRRSVAAVLATAGLFGAGCDYLPDMSAVLPDDPSWTVVDPDGVGPGSITYVVSPPATYPMSKEIGAGAARFDYTEPGPLPELVTHEADGLPFADVAEFGWATFVPSSEPGRVPYLVVDVDQNGDGDLSDVMTLVADEQLDRGGVTQEPAFDEWQFWRAALTDDVWSERVDDGETTVDEPYDMSDLPAEATIAGVRISLGISATSGVSFADAVRIEPVTSGEGGAPAFDRLAWSFEPPANVTEVRNLPSGQLRASPGISVVATPDGNGALRVPFDDTLDPTHELPEFASLSTYDGLPLSQLDAFLMTAWTDPASETCDQPAVIMGVDLDGEIPEEPPTDEGEDTTVLVFAPCFPGDLVLATAEGDDPAPQAGWHTWDVRAGLRLLESETYAGDLDTLLASNPAAAITDLARTGGPDELDSGIILSHAGSMSLDGPPEMSDLPTEDEGTPIPNPALIDRFSIGLEGEPALLQTTDFVASTSGGGGFAGYTITVPAGGGTGTIGLPGGNGSITTTGNAGPGTFTLLPGGTPAGTPGTFHLLGQSWDITPPVGFDFDSAEVCLPYDDTALTAGGYDEDDLALVHYRSDGTLDDVTTSIDTVNHIICGETDSFSPFAIGILDVDRLAGADRAATAAAISAATFAPGAPVAYVVTGEDFADALSGGPAAAAQDGPVLLVGADGIPTATAAELARLQPAEIVVLGGTAAISDDVVEELDRMTTGAVTRLAGADRYATSAAVSAATFAPGVEVAYVATGERFADALTGGAAAARDGAPVLLVSPTSVPTAVSSELERLDPDRIVVLGGTAAVGAAVVEDLGAIAPVTRISGSDRYGTAAAVADTFSAPTQSLFVATGTAFPDALTGVPAAGAAQSPILLVDGALPASTDAQVKRLDPASMRVLGGTAAIADTVVDALRDSMLN